MSDTPIIGGSVLRLVTAGLYDTPLAVYREYIQNSADAIACRSSSGTVQVTIEPALSRVTILDDGVGLAPRQAERQLIDVGNSHKDPRVQRGFRGIGRLSALAFVDRVHFTTRSSGEEPVTQVSWDGQRLRSLDFSDVDAPAVVQACSMSTELPGGDWPDHFFQVTLEGIARHAASSLLNVDAVRRYIGEVGPVPFSPDFALSEPIASLLSEHGAGFALDIRVNEDASGLRRPFQASIPLAGGHRVPFADLDTRVIPSADGDDPAAILWLAHSPYSGSLPAPLGIRGLRARVGNMQIGTERVFEHLFQEPRFNGWCVGEVHVMDPRVLPNGRRDYFEPGAHLRNLENQLGAIAQEISSRCRRASSQRNKLRSLDAAIMRVGQAADLAGSEHLHPEDAAGLVERERGRLDSVRQLLAQIDPAGDSLHHQRLAAHEARLLVGEANGTESHSVLARQATAHDLRCAFAVLAEALAPGEALQLIEAVLDRLYSTQSPPRSARKP